MEDSLMDTIEIPVAEISRILDAMLWVINPYLDQKESLLDTPHIMELADVYNTLVSSIPYGIVLDHQPIELF